MKVLFLGQFAAGVAPRVLANVETPLETSTRGHTAASERARRAAAGLCADRPPQAISRTRNRPYRHKRKPAGPHMEPGCKGTGRNC
jgi:hypothetical protein